MIYYIYSPDDLEFVKSCKIHLSQEHVAYHAFDILETLDLNKASHLLVTGCLDEIKTLLVLADQVTSEVKIETLLDILMVVISA